MLRAYINPKGMIDMPVIDCHVWGHAYGHDIKHSIYNPINHRTTYTLYLTQKLFLYAPIPTWYDRTQILFPYPHTYLYGNLGKILIFYLGRNMISYLDVKI
jgi:hypothetical protein